MRPGDTIAVIALGWLVLGTSCPSLAAPGQSPRDEAWRFLDAGLKDTSVDKRVKALAALGVAAGDARASRPSKNACRIRSRKSARPPSRPWAK